MRKDQVRNRDSIRRDCITAEIDDLKVSTGFNSKGVVITLSEPTAEGDEEGKFQFGMKDSAFYKLAESLWKTRSYLKKRRAIEKP